MKQDLFTYLSSEIITEILSRLPAQTILSCKRVCKSWRNLISTNEFLKLHLSKSAPGLALTVHQHNKIIQFIDVHEGIHHFTTITKLNFTHFASIQGSAHGLLLLQMFKTKLTLHLCNPVTREYIDLLHPRSRQFYPSKFGIVIYGFGVSKISGQYKAVAVFHDLSIPSVTLPEPECKVYTIGTGSWRSVEPDALLRYNINHAGAFVNGNLHWLAHDLNDTLWISCFDLETELFSRFSPPLRNEKKIIEVLLFDVEGSLCLCDYISNGNAVAIWLMKVEKSWTKKFVIEISPNPSFISVFPIRVSENGVVFMARGFGSLFYYSSKDKTIWTICNAEGCVYMTSHSHTPSILSLRCFELENSISF